MGVIHKATSEPSSGCHHPDKSKDKIVQKVIQYLAKPGVTYSINNACCKICGTKKNGKCKQTWLYDWTHRHQREILEAVEFIKKLDS